ncbi:hypothetical protein SAMN05444581_10152 [Methylocapsa palsarum]|uniref:Uncharacterized protein n=1 Tax=Methylocapsa palsarum TaxID=1612308 RepID=A0A1I3VRW8_9HYPH|nr:hypothetical protein SAMN05444581_10152 [Methylocapsa palsarum]
MREDRFARNQESVRRKTDRAIVKWRTVTGNDENYVYAIALS